MSKQEQIIVATLEQLKVISDPLRMKLFEDIRVANKQGRYQPIKQAARNLDMGHAKLYYHVKQLEKHGFIYVADTVYVSGISEKHYAVVADVIVVDQSLMAGEQPLAEAAATMVSVLRGTFDVTLTEVAQLMSSKPTGRKHLHFNRQLLHLTEAMAAEFRGRLKALEKEMAAASRTLAANEGDVYSFTSVFTPTMRQRLLEGANDE